MPVIFDGPEYQLIEETTATSSSLQVILKPGTVARISEDNRADLLGKAANALTSNATYLAIASPTAAQNTAQTKALTRQVNALIRLITDRLDSTAGT